MPVSVNINMAAFRRGLEREIKDHRKDFETALKVTGYRLRDRMKNEVKEGRPGHSVFKPLSFIARGLERRSGTRLRQNRPLIRLANAVFYEIRRTPEFEMHIGFGSRRTQPFFKEMALKHEKGFTRRIGKRLRQFIIHEGARRIHGHRDAEFVESTPFFLRKSTKSFKTPARPIVGPFWMAHREQAWRDIRRRFRSKRAGERI